MSIQKVNIASAGEAGKAVFKTSKEVDFADEFHVQGEDKIVQVSDYDIYQIEGDSLCTAHIFSKDYVLAKKLDLDQKIKIAGGSIIVLEVEENKNSEPSQNLALYKLRKFLMFIDLRIQGNEALYNTVSDRDIRSRFRRNKERFMKKLALAREKYGETLITLSITYRDGERDYSFHSIDNLKGVVEYRIDQSSPCSVQMITTTTDDAETYKEVVEYLSKKNLNHSFYAITPKESIIVFREIFMSSNEEIQLVSNKLSSDICNDKRYLNALQTFLDKENSKLEVFVYSYENENPIYDFLHNYEEKVFIRTSSKGAKFTLDKKIINFCIGDGKAYRLETDVECRHSECNFNDSKTCDFLKEQFYSIFSNNEFSEAVNWK